MPDGPDPPGWHDFISKPTIKQCLDDGLGPYAPSGWVELVGLDRQNCLDYAVGTKMYLWAELEYLPKLFLSCIRLTSPMKRKKVGMILILAPLLGKCAWWINFLVNKIIVMMMMMRCCCDLYPFMCHEIIYLVDGVVVLVYYPSIDVKDKVGIVFIVMLKWKNLFSPFFFSLSLYLLSTYHGCSWKRYLASGLTMMNPFLILSLDLLSTLLASLAVESCLPIFLSHDMDVFRWLGMKHPDDFMGMGIESMETCQILALFTRALQRHLNGLPPLLVEWDDDDDIDEDGNGKARIMRASHKMWTPSCNGV